MTQAAYLSDVLSENEDWLRRVLFNRLRDRELVDEVFQEVGVALSRDDLRPEDSEKLPAWLYRVAVKQSYLARRKLGRFKKLLTSVQERMPIAEHQQDDPLDWMLGVERQQAVRDAIQQLPELDREILMLKYTEGWTYKELAERLGVTVHTIEHRLLRAKKKMRQLLQSVEVVT